MQDALFGRPEHRAAMADFEDKIKLKKLAGRAGVPTTKMYYGTYATDRAALESALRPLCEHASLWLVAKATHLSGGRSVRIIE